MLRPTAESSEMFNPVITLNSYTLNLSSNNNKGKIDDDEDRPDWAATVPVIPSIPPWPQPQQPHTIQSQSSTDVIGAGYIQYHQSLS